MTKTKLIMAVSAVALAAVALGSFYLGKHSGAAYADVPGAAQTAANGPSVPGLCVLSQNAVYANAKVGQAATARYRELNAVLRGQLAPEQQAIQEEAKKLQEAQKTMPAAEFQAKAQDLAKKEQEFKAADALDARDLEATRQKALRLIAADAQPIVTEAYKAHNCGVLFSRDVMLEGNPGMDLTPAVVAGLDSKVTTITFDLEKAAPADAPAPAGQQ